MFPVLVVSEWWIEDGRCERVVAGISWERTAVASGEVLNETAIPHSMANESDARTPCCRSGDLLPMLKVGRSPIFGF
jgi:hypothetical protein